MFHSLADKPNLNLSRLLHGDEALPFQINVRFFRKYRNISKKVNDFDVFLLHDRRKQMQPKCHIMSKLFSVGIAMVFGPISVGHSLALILFLPILSEKH